ncbi:MAG: class I SAM-dependent RNA methyltransferase [Candidatus Rhabdochlamydia sp.]
MKHQQGKISTIAFGGEGIIRYEGLVTFIPYTAIGDEVIYEEIQRKKNFSRAHLVRVIKDSHDRTAANCPHFTRCQGCQFQHLRYEAQLQAKIQFAQDALEKIAKIQPPSLTITPSPSPWNYRKHITLKLRVKEGKLALGYQETTFLPVNECLIFEKGSQELFTEVRGFIEQLEPYEGSLKLISVEDGVILAFTFDTPPPSFEQIAHANLHKWKGICLGTQSWGNVHIPLTVGETKFTLSPYSFMQANSLLAPTLYHKLIELTEGKTVLDLYCGSGILSILLAQKGFKVRGVEAHPQAIASANHHAQFHQVDIPFNEGRVEDLLAHQLQENCPDTLILNPPRQGVHPDVISLLQTSGIKRIIYMSCMPSTLARDLKQLSNYQLKEMFLYDMFPQTTHLETIALLTLKDDASSHSKGL